MYDIQIGIEIEGGTKGMNNIHHVRTHGCTDVRTHGCTDVRTGITRIVHAKLLLPPRIEFPAPVPAAAAVAVHFSGTCCYIDRN